MTKCFFSKYLVMALLTVSAVHHLHAIYFNVYYNDIPGFVERITMIK